MIGIGLFFSLLVATPIAIYFSEKTKHYFFPFFLLFFAVVPANLFCALLLPFIGWNWGLWFFAEVLLLVIGARLLERR